MRQCYFHILIFKKAMPQDNLRSVVYKSFVTCDDPKGVVDCRTFRKSKTNSKKSEEKLEHPKMLKKLKKYTLHKEEKKEMVSKGGTEKSLHASSFQLKEVSRGAQKLNQVIDDSWSKRTTFDGQSKDIAKDLLMGALDLQDSLVMLSKFQEASQCMTKLKKKHKEKPCVGKADELGVERTSSDRFGNPNYQNPRLSADGSSRDCYEELREVIRNSLAKQKLLPPISSQEKAYTRSSKMISYADMPSTSSSSISSMAYSHDFASSESTSSSKIPEEKKPRNSNLIAKLMGLEDFSSKPLQSASQKQLQRESGLTQKPIFDIDMQKGRTPEVVGQKVDRGCMTLENIIDNMQFQGLQTYPPNTSYTERRLSNDASPIVLIKPMHPGVEAEKHFHRKLIQERATLNSEKKQRFWKTKEDTTPNIMEYHRGDFNSNELRGKLHTEEPPMKKLSPEKEAKTSRKVFAKPRDVEVIIEQKQSSNKMNASVPVSSLPQNNEIVEKKVDKIQKATSPKKQVEIESVKSKSVPRSLEDKVTTTKLRKSETGSNIMNKKCISQKTSTTSNFTIKRTKSALAYRESDQKRSMKNSKPVKELLIANFNRDLKVAKTECNDDDKLTNLKEKSNTSIMDSAPAVQLVTEEETDAILIQENCDNRLKTLCKDSMLSTPHVNNTKCPDEATDYNQHDLKEINFCQTETTADVTIISRTQESLQVEEPSDNCDAYQPIVLQALTSLHDSGLLNFKLLLDCANELLERSQRDELLTSALLHVPINDSRVCMSKDKLVEEACNEIENLRSYSNHGVNSVPAADIVFSVLERDLLCKGLAAGAWDLGWREGFTRDEVEQIVSDLDKLVINQLIEEVFADFVV